MRRTGNFIAVCPDTGARLCKDKKWREFADFGTYPECVHVYRYLGAAEKAAAKYRLRKAEPGETLLRIIHLHKGDSMNAAGEVTRSYE